VDEMKLFQELDLKITLNSEFKVQPLIQKYRIQRHDAEKILSSETIEKFSDMGCDIREVQLFSGIPKTKFDIHIDGHCVQNSIGAVNFVLPGCNDWSMEWFETTEKNLSQLISSGNTDYMSLNEADCRLTNSLTTDRAFIVRVDIPHRIINRDKSTRHCISIRFKNNNFEYLLEKLK